MLRVDKYIVYCYIIYMPYKDKNKQKEAVRRYYQRHKEKCLENNKSWYNSNKEHCSERSKTYYEENKESIAARTLSNYHKKRYRNGERHLIENYAAAKANNFKGWILHHRLELTINGEYACSTDTLKRLDMYYNRPYFELIYLKTEVHTALHNKARWKANLKIGRQPRKKASI